MAQSTRYEGKTYTIVWGYESQNNHNTTAAAGVLDAFGPDSTVKVTGDIDGTRLCIHRDIYGALREVTICDPPNPETGNARGPDPLLRLPLRQTTPAVQNTRPTTPTVEQASLDHARPGERQADPDRYHQLMADVLVRAGGVLLAADLCWSVSARACSIRHSTEHVLVDDVKGKILNWLGATAGVGGPTFGEKGARPY